MPLVTIDYFEPKDPRVIASLFDKVRSEGAKALGCSTENIWVIFQPVRPSYYVQDSELTLSPIVTIKAQTGRTADQRKLFVENTARVVGGELSVKPERVWIHYQEMRPEDVWVEGRHSEP